MNYPSRSRPILKYIKLSHVLRLLTLVGVFVLPWGFYPNVTEGKTSSTEIYGPEKIFVFYFLIFVVSGLVFLWMKKKYNYWTNFAVPCPKPLPVVGHTLHRFGIIGHILEFYENIYYKYNGKDFCGFYEFLNPGIIVGNLELIRSITIKDFDHFANRRVFPMSKISPVANKMLSNATGKEWREIRMAISPVFSVNKLRNLYPLVCQQGDKFVGLLRQVGDQRKEIEIRELCGQFTMETIASCAFGIECNAMDSDRATFTKMASKIFVLSPLRALKNYAKRRWLLKRSSSYWPDLITLRAPFHSLFIYSPSIRIFNKSSGKKYLVRKFGSEQVKRSSSQFGVFIETRSTGTIQMTLTRIDFQILVTGTLVHTFPSALDLDSALDFDLLMLSLKLVYTKY
ncbi:putative cytochrome P450 [Armadillidium nasatum]|uniref:Putative cytochrome P450 n=1 Tax=Armadillidium nasatum TaxID=96803 RepID=A0A5N5T8D7_9CRUS|nr:putative cytochrome P450 [Armadillidium nasatum]